MPKRLFFNQFSYPKVNLYAPLPPAALLDIGRADLPDTDQQPEQAYMASAAFLSVVMSAIALCNWPVLVDQHCGIMTMLILHSLIGWRLCPVNRYTLALKVAAEFDPLLHQAGTC